MKANNSYNVLLSTHICSVTVFHVGNKLIILRVIPKSALKHDRHRPLHKGISWANIIGACISGTLRYFTNTAYNLCI